MSKTGGKALAAQKRAGEAPSKNRWGFGQRGEPQNVEEGREGAPERVGTMTADEMAEFAIRHLYTPGMFGRVFMESSEDDDSEDADGFPS